GSKRRFESGPKTRTRSRASASRWRNAAGWRMRCATGRRRCRTASTLPTSTTTWPIPSRCLDAAPNPAHTVHFRAGCKASGDSGWICSAKRGNGCQVEPVPAPEETLLPPPPPGPGTLGALRPPLLNVFLFLLTFASAFIAGSALNDTQLPEPTRSEMWHHGLGFSLALLLIMLSHEMGHFLLARRHKVDATWPFFIPAPLLSIIGTLGAVIRLRSLPRTRTALLDIGAAGPIAGFLVTIPVLVLGLKWSTLVAAEPSTPRWTLFEAAPRLHRFFGPPLSAALLALGVFTAFPGWIIWGLLMGLGLGFHPPLSQPEERLDGPRRFLVLASLALLVLSFSPVPLALLAG